MNEFEKRMNALRRQYTAEQRLITKDANRTIARLNAAIKAVDSLEAREALRAEKQRTYETMRRTHNINRTCYLQQLELIADEQVLHHKNNPSKSQVRRLMARLSEQANGHKPMIIAFGDNRLAEIKFI